MHAVVQATKQNSVEEQAAAPDALAMARRQAAAEAAVLGDGIATAGRFQDADFFVPKAPSASTRFEEEEFSVRGGASSLMDGAILDLLADDQVVFRAG